MLTDSGGTLSPPVTPGVPERFTTPGVHASIHSLDARVQRVEAQTNEIPQLVVDVGEVKKYLANVKALENIVRHIMGKGILLIVSAIGGTYGVTKVTAPSAPILTPAPTKSATTVRLEAIQAMQPGPEKDRELIRFIVETAPVGQR